MNIQIRNDEELAAVMAAIKDYLEGEFILNEEQESLLFNARWWCGYYIKITDIDKVNRKGFEVIKKEVKS